MKTQMLSPQKAERPSAEKQRSYQVRLKRLCSRPGPYRTQFSTVPTSSIAPTTRGASNIHVGAEACLATWRGCREQNHPAGHFRSAGVDRACQGVDAELSTRITPGFEALVFKASRGIEDIYDSPTSARTAAVSGGCLGTALRDEQDAISDNLLIGHGQHRRKQIVAERILLVQRLRDQQFYTRSLIDLPSTHHDHRSSGLSRC